MDRRAREDGGREMGRMGRMEEGEDGGWGGWGRGRGGWEDGGV